MPTIETIQKAISQLPPLPGSYGRINIVVNEETVFRIYPYRFSFVQEICTNSWRLHSIESIKQLNN